MPALLPPTHPPISSPEIVPEAQLEPLVEMYTPEAEERLLGGQPDFVLDAIDNIDTKVTRGCVFISGCPVSALNWCWNRD